MSVPSLSKTALYRDSNSKSCFDFKRATGPASVERQPKKGESELPEMHVKTRDISGEDKFWDLIQTKNRQLLQKQHDQI